MEKIHCNRVSEPQALRQNGSRHQINERVKMPSIASRPKDPVRTYSLGRDQRLRLAQGAIESSQTKMACQRIAEMGKQVVSMDKSRNILPAIDYKRNTESKQKADGIRHSCLLCPDLTGNIGEAQMFGLVKNKVMKNSAAD